MFPEQKGPSSGTNNGSGGSSRGPACRQLVRHEGRSPSVHHGAAERKLFADRLDRQVESRAVAPAGSALAVHTARLTSRQERERLARALHEVVRDAFNHESAHAGAAAPDPDRRGRAPHP